jgi:hypothetical protein
MNIQNLSETSRRHAKLSFTVQEERMNGTTGINHILNSLNAQDMLIGFFIWSKLHWTINLVFRWKDHLIGLAGRTKA